MPNHDGRNVLIMGDSHAADLWKGLAQSFPTVHFLQATAVGCKPSLDDRGAEPCHSLMQSTLRRFIPSAKPDDVIISADWNTADIPALLKTIRYLRILHERVFVAGQVPEYELDLPRVLAMTVHTHGRLHVSDARLPESKDTDNAFIARLRGSGATYVSIYRLRCPRDECATTDAAGTPLQFDSSHFTDAGSRWLGERLKATAAMDFSRRFTEHAGAPPGPARSAAHA